MPTVGHSRVLEATPEQLWEVVGDPHHLPRWWPRVMRVEGVQDDAFTEVLVGARGKALRADFRLVERQPQRKAVWAQELHGSPFERVLSSFETEIELLPRPAAGQLGGADKAAASTGSREAPVGGDGEAAVATEVRIEVRQTLRGLLVRLGSPLVRRAASATIQEALDGLERAVVG